MENGLCLHQTSTLDETLCHAIGNIQDEKELRDGAELLSGEPIFSPDFMETLKNHTCS
jgi:hypothetical protein